MNREDLEAMEGLYLFRDVPRESLIRLALLAPPARFKPGERVFQQGHTADVALLVLTGRLVATVRAGQEEKRVGDVAPGEIVGEQALFGGRHRNATVTAVAPTSCLIMSPEVFEKAPGNPAVVAIETSLLGSMARRIRRTNLSIQKAWNEQTQAPPAPNRPTFRDRLRSLFGGA